MEEVQDVNFKQIFNNAKQEGPEGVLRVLQNLQKIATVIGEAKTQDEMLEQLILSLDHEEIIEDELLIAICEQLPGLLPLMEGDQYMEKIFKIFEIVCATDESLVRLKAVEAIGIVVQGFTDEMHQKVLFPFIQLLSSTSWLSSKCTAADLLAKCYLHLSDTEKAELRNIAKVLTHDDMSIIRKAVAISMIEFIKVLEPEIIKEEFLPIFDKIAIDDMDNVRATSTDLFIEVTKRMSDLDDQKLVFERIEKLSEDVSWRVRQRTALSIHEIQKSWCHPRFRGGVLAIFQALAKDQESEVRVFVAKNFFKYTTALHDSYKSQPENNFESVFEQSILPILQNMIIDDDNNVRLEVSTHILPLGNIVSVKFFEDNLLPIVVNALEHSGSVEFQENILKSISSLPASIDITKSLKSIHLTMQNLLVNSFSHWRMRRSILVALVHLGKHSSKEYFEENLKICYTNLICDNIFAVKRTTAIAVPCFAKQYGIKWTYENIIPIFLSKRYDAKYLNRMIPLFCMQEVIDPSILKGDTSHEGVLESFKQFIHSEDEILKKNSTKILGTISRLCKDVEKKLENQFNQDIYAHKDILDDNVKFYAEDTLETLQACDINPFTVSNNDIIDSSQLTYLEGLLFLIYNEFLLVIQDLSKDPVENVRTQTVNMLLKIRNFINNLHNETTQSWVTDVLDNLKTDQKENIEKRVSRDLNIRIPQIEKEVKVDTTLMDTMIINKDEPLPDLGSEIPELDISNNMNAVFYNSSVEHKNEVADKVEYIDEQTEDILEENKETENIAQTDEIQEATTSFNEEEINNNIEESNTDPAEKTDSKSKDVTKEDTSSEESKSKTVKDENVEIKQVNNSDETIS